MGIRIEEMSIDNLKKIYDFEVENKLYFEKTLPPRPKEYFDFETFQILMNELLEEQVRGDVYMCIILDSNEKMIGRVNLSSINRETKKAEIGYRISEKEQGKGFASKSVKIMIEKCTNKFDLELIEAGTATKNLESQRVLIKNGFKLIGGEQKVMKVNNEWIDGLLFEKHCAKS